MSRSAQPWWRTLVVVGALLLVLASMSAAQSPLGVRVNDEVKFDEVAGQVKVRLTVSDANGYAITGIAQHKEYIQIYEDGVLVPGIADVAESVNKDVQVYIALVLDTSGSMNGKPLDDLKQAANQCLSALAPQDRAAVIAFSNEVDLGEPFPKIDSKKEAGFTHDKGLLKNLVNQLLAEVGNTTPLYDAFLKAVKMTRSQPKQNRAIILMTDGVDEGTTKGQPGSKVAKPDDPVDLAREAGIPVYTVGLGKSDNFDAGYLQRVALLTGGFYNGTQDSAELGRLFQQVVDLLKTEYLVSYKPPKGPDGKEHQVLVKVSLPERGTAQNDPPARYTAPPPLTPDIRMYYWEGSDKLALASDQKVRGRTITFTPQILSRGLIMKVEYSVDEATAPVVADEPPFDFVWRTAAYATGTHKITVKAYDDADPAHVGTAEVMVQLVRSPLEEIGKTFGEPVGGTGIPLWAVALALLLLIGGLVLLLLPKKRRCEACGRVIPRSWDHCLFCEKQGETVAMGDVETGEERPTSRDLPVGFETREAKMPPGFGPGVSPPRDKTVVMHRPPEKLAYLIIQKGTHLGRQFQLESETSIGRADSNTIVLDDPAVGRQQSKIKLEKDEFYIYDLASTNPTLVNGQKALKHRLVDGDRLQIGDTVLVFKAV